jgi:hypothetical protein
MIHTKRVDIVILSGQKVKGKNSLLYYDNNQKALLPRVQGERS